MAIGDVGSYGRRIGVTLIVTGVTLLVVVGVYIGKDAVISRFRPELVPSAIAHQIAFSPFVLQESIVEGEPAMTDYKYDSESEVYSYIVRHTNSRTITVSQQASPPSFSEVPEQYTKLLDGLNRYATIETINGTLYLTRPKQEQQVAVMNERGVLMFARLNQGSLPDRDWKQFVDSLEIYKIAKNSN